MTLSEFKSLKRGQMVYFYPSPGGRLCMVQGRFKCYEEGERVWFVDDSIHEYGQGIHFSCPLAIHTQAFKCSEDAESALKADHLRGNIEQRTMRSR